MSDEFSVFIPPAPAWLYDMALEKLGALLAGIPAHQRESAARQLVEAVAMIAVAEAPGKAEAFWRAAAADVRLRPHEDRTPPPASVPQPDPSMGYLAFLYAVLGGAVIGAAAMVFFRGAV
jgi:hypothetical protein